VSRGGASCTVIGFPTTRANAAATSLGEYSRGPASSMTRLLLPPSASRRAAAVPMSRVATKGHPLADADQRAGASAKASSPGAPSADLRVGRGHDW